MARRKLKAKTRRKIQRGIALLALLLVVLAIGVVAVLDHRVTRQFEGRRWTLPARVYAQPIELYVGLPMSAKRAASELDRLGYLAVARADRPGTYSRRGDRINLYLRAFRFSDGVQAARLLDIGFAGDSVSSLRDANHADVPVIPA